MLRTNAGQKAAEARTEEISRDRVLTNSELPAIWREAGVGDYAAIVRLLILTGQRREEAGGMLWSEIDTAGAVWHIGAGRTKNGLAHDVPLSAAALAVLSGLERHVGRDLIFGAGDGPYQGWSRAKAALDARIAAALGRPPPPWRLHDIRRTVATRLADLGVLPHVIEAVLNHVSGHKAGVAGVYNRASYAAEKRAALTLWSDHVAALVETVERKPDGPTKKVHPSAAKPTGDIPARLKELRGPELTERQVALASAWVKAQADLQTQRQFDDAFDRVLEINSLNKALENETDQEERGRIDKEIRGLKSKLRLLRKQRRFHESHISILPLYNILGKRTVTRTYHAASSIWTSGGLVRLSSLARSVPASGRSSG